VDEYGWWDTKLNLRKRKREMNEGLKMVITPEKGTKEKGCV